MVAVVGVGVHRGDVATIRGASQGLDGIICSDTVLPLLLHVVKTVVCGTWKHALLCQKKCTRMPVGYILIDIYFLVARSRRLISSFFIPISAQSSSVKPCRSRVAVAPRSRNASSYCCKFCAARKSDNEVAIGS